MLERLGGRKGFSESDRVVGRVLWFRGWGGGSESANSLLKTLER